MPCFLISRHIASQVHYRSTFEVSIGWSSVNVRFVPFFPEGQNKALNGLITGYRYPSVIISKRGGIVKNIQLDGQGIHRVAEELTSLGSNS